MSKPLYTAAYPSFSPSDRIALATLIRRRAAPHCRMAEIGSWLGQGSTQVFLEGMREHVGSSLLCIDTWRGSTNSRKHRAIVDEFDVFGTFRDNVEKAGSPVVVSTLIAASDEAAAIVADAAFDVVFIDANHSYASVRADIAAWRSKVRPGGLLCGHDCELRVSPAVYQRLFDNRELVTISGEGTPFAEIHPGTVLAVHEAFDGEACLFAEMPINCDDGSASRSTIWFVDIPEHGTLKSA